MIVMIQKEKNEDGGDDNVYGDDGCMAIALMMITELDEDVSYLIIFPI